jgi:hypothetical protein
LRLSLDDSERGRAPAAEDLPLELAGGFDDNSRPPAHTTPGLTGAVEISGQAGRENERPPPQRPMPSLPEVDDDVKPCPRCRASLHPRARRCYKCGHRLDPVQEEDDLGIRRRSRARLDVEPHRGALILTLGILSVVSGLTVVCFPVGLILGICAWVMGQGDLRRMAAGAMDDEGDALTRGGWVCGIIGTIVSALLGLSCGGMITLMTLAENRQPAPRPRWGQIRPIHTAPTAFGQAICSRPAVQ